MSHDLSFIHTATMEHLKQNNSSVNVTISNIYSQLQKQMADKQFNIVYCV